MHVLKKSGVQSAFGSAKNITFAKNATFWQKLSFGPKLRTRKTLWSFGGP